MKKIDYYIACHLVGMVALAWLLVIGMNALFSFLGEINDLGRGHYDLPQAAAYVLLSLPASAYQLFPIAALIGTLLGLGNLSVRGELIAIRLAGLSRFRIVASVTGTGILMLFLVVALGEWLAPQAQRDARQLRTTAIHEQFSIATDNGVWLRDGDRFVHIRGMNSARELVDIRRYQVTDQQRLREADYTPFAAWGDGVWQLRDQRRSLFEAGHIQTSSVELDDWHSSVPPELIGVLMLLPENMSLRELYQYMNYLQIGNMDVRHYRLAFWMRIAAPLSALVMLVLAVGFVLGILSNTSVGKRLFIGILIGLAYQLTTDVLAQAGLVYGLPALVSAFMPVLLFLVLAMWSIHKV